jgi:DHA2 family multidrug resistance protein
MKRTILMITVIAAAIMELIDTSIVNVALSYMSGNLGATLEDTSWVITAYAIANVIIIPITSFLSDPRPSYTNCSPGKNKMWPAPCLELASL